MKEKLDAFLDLPLLHRVGALFGLVSVLVGGFFYFVLSPLQMEVGEMSDRATDLDKEIQALVIKANRLDFFKKEVERLDVELAKALRELPDKKEIDTLLTRISDKAKDSGLDVVLFKPEAEQKKDFYAEVPVSIELRGSFHQLASFFDEVSHLERIVNMTQFRIQQDSKDDSETLRTNVIATSFRFLDESERPMEEVNSKKKRRKKK